MMNQYHNFLIPTKTAYRFFMLSTVCLTVLSSTEATAAITPPVLKGIAIPITPGLLDGSTPIIIDKTVAIALGKALFWDASVGSDGIACASCHFHAGADRRVNNQLAPGLNHKTATSKTFEKTLSSAVGGINYTLKRSDFPLHKLANPLKKDSTVLFDTDDTVSSGGAFLSDFKGINQNSRKDDCSSVKDAVFHAGNINTRQTTPRNSPSVINAAFNFRNFWDGRANNIFNGVSAFGARDTNASIWVVDQNNHITRQHMQLKNASLASQAVAPVLSTVEMSCADRLFSDVGRKLLPRRPLIMQEVHANDSVLAPLRHASGKGLNTSYQALIKMAFAPRYWAAKGIVDALKAKNAVPYSQMEANFSMFFGLALQLYQQTLISDDTLFDSPRTPGPDPQIPENFNSKQARGLQVFMTSGCINCHKGPTFSSAVHPDLLKTDFTYSSPRLINRKPLKGGFNGEHLIQGLFDEGYFNTGVTPDSYDPGLGGVDSFGNPLSFTTQYVQQLLTGKPLLDPAAINSCDLDNLFLNEYNSDELRKDPYIKGDCGSNRTFYAQIPTVLVLQTEFKKGDSARDRIAVQGAFKTPSLRNIELTGPYMHNGSLLTLDQVIDFYGRSGNFTNLAHASRLIASRQLTDENKSDLIAFLKSLTDERVRWEKAPFDHPQLKIPHGHSARMSINNPQHAEDIFLTLPAVGQNGRDASIGPLKAFEEYLK